MDFITWCGQVLDRLVDAAASSTTIRTKGLTQRQIAEIVLGSAIFDDPGYAASTHRTGLREAVGVLYDRQLLQDTDWPEKPWEVLRLTPNGRKGSADLEAGWEIVFLSDDLGEEESALLEVVNTRSERREVDHAWIESVPEHEVAEALDWAGGPELVAHVAREMTRFDGRGLVRAGIVKEGIPVIRATYDGLVRTQRADAPRPLTQFLDGLGSNPGGAAPSVNERDFSFITDPDLRRVLQEDYREAQACLAAQSWKGSALLSAGVIEGILLDALRSPNAVDHPDFPDLSAKLPHRADDIHWDRVGLTDLLKLAQGLSLITTEAGRMLEGTRDYRDTVHPNAEVRRGSRADHADASLLLELVRFLYARFDA